MRTLKPIALSAWLALALAGSLDAQDRIPWVTDLKVARQMAEQQQRLVLLHFWTESCAPCQRLERSVFNQPEFIRAVSGAFIPVRINTQQSPDLASYYKVTAIPTDIIVDPSGKEIFRGASPQDATAYIGVLDAIKAHRNVGQAVPTELLASASRMFTPPWQGTNLPPGIDTSSPFAPPTASDLAPPNQAVPSASASPPARPAYMQNPYTNPVNADHAQPAVSAYGPRYGNAADAAGNPATPNLGTSAAAPAWQAPAPPPGVPTTAIQAPFAPADRLGSTLPAFGGNQTNTALNTVPSLGSSNTAPQAGLPLAGANDQTRWNANSVLPSRPWDNAPGPSNQPPVNAGIDPQAALRSTPPSLPAPSAGQPPMALDGYCPVALVEQSKWSKGDPRWGAVHRDRVYLFASPQAQQQFLANPDHFSPLLAGHDAVRYAETGQLVVGKREHGVYFRDRILLFADEEALQRFGSRPEYYIATAEQVAPRGGAGAPMPPGMPYR